MSTEEKLMLLTELWDELTLKPDEVTLTPDQEDLLDQRWHALGGRKSESSARHTVIEVIFLAGRRALCARESF